MSNVKDLTGKRFGHLRVLSLHGVESKSKKSLWSCLCHCGKNIVVVGANLTSARTESCGCVRGEKTKQHRGTKLYEVWKGMRSRCNNKNHIGFKNYGGRGIKVCARWSSYLNFLSDMGSSYKEGLSIDRINNNSDYCPENCRWVTKKENSRGSRRAKINMCIAVAIRCSTDSYISLAKKHNVSIHTIKAVKLKKVWV